MVDGSSWNIEVDDSLKNVQVQADVNWGDVGIQSSRMRDKNGGILAMVEDDVFVCPCQSGGQDLKGMN